MSSLVQGLGLVAVQRSARASAAMASTSSSNSACTTPASLMVEGIPSLSMELRMVRMSWRALCRTLELSSRSRREIWAYRLAVGVSPSMQPALKLMT